MDKKRETQISKFMSLVLRHQPSAADLELDEHGWAKVHDIINNEALPFSYDELVEVVQNNAKKRFDLDTEKGLIRANQGHSIDVDMEFEEKEPPALLYHGTTDKAWKAIQYSGIKKMKRQHVHLSPDTKTAYTVAQRRQGPFVVLVVDTVDMRKHGYKFFLSKNGVWLTDYVPARFLTREVV